MNDDPDDLAVEEIIDQFRDPRILLYRPLAKRGPTRSFNLIFSDRNAKYVALLEDDNWWEPTFISEMLSTFQKFTDVNAVCCNERIWIENQDGSWTDTEEYIWPDLGSIVYKPQLSDLCGRAKLCNSSTVYKISDDLKFLTPDDIPVDVTEHFRERLLKDGIGLNSAPLANYSVTVSTSRSGGSLWGEYQLLLVASAFAALEGETSRRRLAVVLWNECKDKRGGRAVSLATCGIHFREARQLLRLAPATAVLGAVAFALRRPAFFLKALRLRAKRGDHFRFLRDAPLTKDLASKFEASRPEEYVF